MYVLPGALAPLAAYRQFVLVLFMPKREDDGTVILGETIKLPMNSHGRVVLAEIQPAHGFPVYEGSNAHNPHNWMGVNEAAALADSLPVPRDAIKWGVGFVITADDDIMCLDLDKCTAPLGGWIPEVAAMIAKFPGAVELSNSGRGLHVWARYTGVMPGHGKKSDKLRGHSWMEFYTESRFMALGSTANGTMHDLTALLPGFIAEYFPPMLIDTTEGGVWREGPCEGHTVLTDDDLIAKAMSRTRQVDPAGMFSNARPLPSFADLWTRDMSVLALAFPPDAAGKEMNGSDADFALAKELAYWTGKDHARIERLMQQSGLVRDKWGTMRRNWTYLQQTILNGVAACTAVYHKPAPPPLHLPGATGSKLVAKVIDHNTFIGREDMAALFAGCVYVQDLNAILLPNGDIVDQARFKARFAGYTFAMDNANETRPTKDAWDAFINNQVIAFPRVEGTLFQPGMGFQDVIERAGRNWVNVYKAPVVDRRPGDVTPFMNLLKKILPKGDDATILLSYMAAIVQYPGVKFRWAPFIQGTQGNGKSTLVECLKYALGRKYIFSVKAKMVTNDFNAWTEYNVLYIADDIYTTADRNDIMEALKSLITDRDQPITLKGVDSIQKEICGNFIFTDNHKDAMKKTDDSRRLCTLYSAQQSKRDRVRDGLTKAFFAGPGGFVPWLESGGYAYVAEMLYTMPIDPRYNPAGECQEAPDTSATREAIIDGRTGVEHEVAEWIELGEPGFCGDFVSYDMLKRKLMETPQFSKSASPLKVKEMLGRLGYEMHRGLPEGRTVVDVQPDDKRAILYVKSDSAMADMDDAAVIAALYTDAQETALASARAKMFNTVKGV